MVTRSSVSPNTIIAASHLASFQHLSEMPIKVETRESNHVAGSCHLLDLRAQGDRIGLAH